MNGSEKEVGDSIETLLQQDQTRRFRQADLRHDNPSLPVRGRPVLANALDPLLPVEVESALKKELSRKTHSMKERRASKFLSFFAFDSAAAQTVSTEERERRGGYGNAPQLFARGTSTTCFSFLLRSSRFFCASCFISSSSAVSLTEVASFPAPQDVLPLDIFDASLSHGTKETADSWATMGEERVSFLEEDVDAGMSE